MVRFYLTRGGGRLFQLPMVLATLAIATLPTPLLSGPLLLERQHFPLPTTLIGVEPTQLPRGNLGQFSWWLHKQRYFLLLREDLLLLMPVSPLRISSVSGAITRDIFPGTVPCQLLLLAL